MVVEEVEEEGGIEVGVEDGEVLMLAGAEEVEMPTKRGGGAGAGDEGRD
jgi:hypothetical protein